MSWFNTRAPAQGTGFSPSQSTPAQRGTTPTENWYSGLANQTAYATSAMDVDNLRARPFVVGRAGYIDRIAFELTTAGGAGSVARCGIYKATSKYNLYPRDLLIDGGEFACDGSTGVKSTTVNLYLPEGLYYLACLAGVSAPTLRFSVVGSVPSFLGCPNTIGANIYVSVNVAKAYGALPSTFTAGGSPSNANNALAHIRWAY